MNNLVNSIPITMAEHQLELFADAGLFKGLANQNMLFHQCICELVDNSIAAKKDNEPFVVNIIFFKKSTQRKLYSLYR